MTHTCAAPWVDPCRACQQDEAYREQVGDEHADYMAALVASAPVEDAAA